MTVHPAQERSWEGLHLDDRLALKQAAAHLAQEFSGDYAGASASLERAVALDPGNSTYAAEGQSIADMRSNTDRLSRQAVTSE